MGDRPAGPRRGRWFGTVRSRLTLLATVVVAGMLLVSSLWVIAVQRRLLTHGIEESLRQRADNVAVELARVPLGGTLPREGDHEDSFLQLVDDSGRVIAASPDADLTTPVVGPLEAGTAQAIRTVTDPVHRPGEFRVLARRVTVSSGSATLVVGKNLDDVNESVRILTLSLLVSIPVVVAMLAALLWWLTGRILRPVESIRAEAASIQGTELDRRLPVPASDDEISRLSRTMNQLLDRVEHATERQQMFVADASHELRGPLTRIRSDLEVSIARPASVDPETLYRSLLADATELQELIDDLLFLARSESGASDPVTAPVDLDDLVLDEARRMGRADRIRVDTTAVSAARVLGHAGQLARGIRNLASNAERHARTVVAFELREYDGMSELVVADDGPGIPTEHHAAVFERFTRLDEARSRDAGGSGLGLAIVHDIVARHGGTIVIASSDCEGARFVVTLPRAD
jgi:signal transduction histidine kinase